VDDSTPDRDPSRGWVAQFHRHLEVALSKKVGRLDVVKIWRDVREISGNQLFDRTIQDAVQGSALFIALSSRGYVESDYCRQELQSFARKAQQEAIGLAVGDEYRIFNVLLNNIPPSARPPEYGRATGFPFHDAADAEQDGEALDPSHDQFRAQLRALTEALYRTLSRLKGRSAAADKPRAESTDRFVVYLGEPSDNLRSVRKRITRELGDAGLAVAAAVPPPFDAAEHDEAARNAITAADLSVHLLDANPGREVVGQEGSCYPQRQVELALQHGKAPLILVPQGVTRESIEDARYGEFLDRLENAPRGDSAYHFQRELPSAMTRQILSRVEEVKAARRPPPAAAVGATLLDTHIKDQLYAFELGQYLLKRQVKTLINPQEDDPGKHLELFTERLKEVAILIIFFGAVPWEWVRERLAFALHIAVANGCPLKACGVYIAPPRKPDLAQSFTLPLVGLEWMDHTNGFNSEAVDHLLARAGAGAIS
jgi:TIR domain